MNLLLKREYLIISILLLLSFVLVDVLHYSILLLIGAGVVYFINQKYWPSIVIILFFIIPSELSAGIRDILNMLCVFILAYLYLVKHGISFYKLNEIPINFKYTIFFIILITLLSTLVSSYYSLGFSEQFRQIIFFGIIYLLFSLVHNEEDVLNYFYALEISSLILGSTLLYNFIFTGAYDQILIRDLTPQKGMIDTIAPFIIVFGVTIPISLFLSIKSKKNKIIHLVIFLITGLSLLLTFSRASILGAFVASSIILFYYYKKYFLSISLFIAILLLFSFITSNPIADFISTMFKFNRVAENTRYPLWEISVNVFKDNWLFGVGPGAFKYYIYKYLNVEFGSFTEGQIRYIVETTGAGHSHNMFLFKAVELGLMGVLSLIYFLFLLFKYAFIIFKRNTNIKKDYALMIIASIIGILARNTVESTGLLTYGWIARDLPIWIVIISLLVFYKNENPNTI